MSTQKTNNPSNWLDMVPTLLFSALLIAGWYWSTTRMKDADLSFIYTHKVSTTISRPFQINHYDNDKKLSCNLSTGTKIETKKALFPQNEIPSLPLFEVAITYPDAAFINDNYVSFNGVGTRLFFPPRKTASIEGICHQGIMTIDGKELDRLTNNHIVDTVLVALADATYFSGE